jgi:hypothetical protein
MLDICVAFALASRIEDDLEVDDIRIEEDLDDDIMGCATEWRRVAGEEKTIRRSTPRSCLGFFFLFRKLEEELSSRSSIFSSFGNLKRTWKEREERKGKLRRLKGLKD